MWRYELCPWPTDRHDASSRVVFYDHDYVAERDAVCRLRRRHEWMHFLFVPFYPLLGLIWSEWKQGWLSRVGFEPRSVTSASVALVFNLFIVEGIFVGWLHGGLLEWLLVDGRLRPADLLLTLLLAADSFVRYGQLLNTETPRYWGFCEWLLPWRWRAPAEA